MKMFIGSILRELSEFESQSNRFFILKNLNQNIQIILSKT
jgi:hypothetical protein